VAGPVGARLLVYGDIFRVVLHSALLGSRASHPPAYQKIKHPILNFTRGSGGRDARGPREELELFINQFAKIAISAGIVSHNNPFKRKKTIPQNPSLLIQVFKLISIC